MMEVPTARIEAFMSKVRKVGNNCWIRGANGTAPWWFDGKEYSPAVAGWIIRYGRKPKGRMGSSCDTKHCCNPHHRTDLVSEQGRGGGRKYARRPHHRRHAQLDHMDLKKLPHLRIPACPRCGAPPVHFECVVCGSPR